MAKTMVFDFTSAVLSVGFGRPTSPVAINQNIFGDGNPPDASVGIPHEPLWGNIENERSGAA